MPAMSSTAASSRPAVVASASKVRLRISFLLAITGLVWWPVPMDVCAKRRISSDVRAEQDRPARVSRDFCHPGSRRPVGKPLAGLLHEKGGAQVSATMLLAGSSCGQPCTRIPLSPGGRRRRQLPQPASPTSSGEGDLGPWLGAGHGDVMGLAGGTTLKVAGLLESAASTPRNLDPREAGGPLPLICAQRPHQIC
jgi:hypothetical protein